MKLRDLEDLCALVREPGPALQIRCGGSKSPDLTRVPSRERASGMDSELKPENTQLTKPGADSAVATQLLDLGAIDSLAGVEDYQPDEYTITAKAATPVNELVELLAQNGQYLPFDPLLVAEGATVGGTVASNASGSGRYRHGGIRDFVLAVRFVDGLGTKIRGGAPVVKNAAGLDLPKLMVGSLGSLGCLTEVTLKVFPAPLAHRTLLVHQLDIESGLGLLSSLQAKPTEVLAVDLVTIESERSFSRAGSRSAGGRKSRRSWTLAVRIGGPEKGLESRLSALESWGRSRALSEHDIETLSGPREARYWSRASSLWWSGEQHAVIKVPVTAARFRETEGAGIFSKFDRVFSAGQQLFVSVPFPRLDQVATALSQLDLRGQLVRFPSATATATGSLTEASASETGPLTRVAVAERFRGVVGASNQNPFLDRVKQALDPAGRFLSTF